MSERPAHILEAAEWGRLNFLEARDGREATMQFARRTYAAYRHTLRYGFGMPGRRAIKGDRRGGRGLFMRRQMIESCMVLRWYLRAYKPVEHEVESA
ncbi:MAG TPA: hypothetical protein VHP37_33705 [Burkholderiales bacterium]|nr:hypothetical protein [Burkholderiales bacterium]